MSLIRKHVAVLQAWACLDLVLPVVQFMMQIELNFIYFIFYGVCLPQLGSVPAAYAVVAGGCDWPLPPPPRPIQ